MLLAYIEKNPLLHHFTVLNISDYFLRGLEWYVKICIFFHPKRISGTVSIKYTLTWAVRETQKRSIWSIKGSEHLRWCISFYLPSVELRYLWTSQRLTALIFISDAEKLYLFSKEAYFRKIIATISTEISCVSSYSSRFFESRIHMCKLIWLPFR